MALTEYDTSSQVRWMGVLNLEGKTPETLKRHLIVNVNVILIKR